jgi:hypothetical protein
MKIYILLIIIFVLSNFVLTLLIDFIFEIENAQVLFFCLFTSTTTYSLEKRKVSFVKFIRHIFFYIVI